MLYNALYMLQGAFHILQSELHMLHFAYHMPHGALIQIKSYIIALLCKCAMHVQFKFNHELRIQVVKTSLILFHKNNSKTKNY